MNRLITGPRFVLEALRGHSKVTKVFVDAKRPDVDVYALANEQGISIEERSGADLDRLTKGARHQGCVAQALPYRYVELLDALNEANEHPLIVALDEITDPHNLGAIIRSCVVFGADAVLIPKHRSASITPTVVRSSAGATEHAQLVQVVNLQRSLMELKDHGFTVFGLDAEANDSVSSIATQGARAIVVGSEGKGLRRMVRQRCDMLVAIPQHGPLDSLNASVAAGIAIHQAATIPA